MLHISFDFQIGFSRGKEVAVIQKLTRQVVDAQKALRSARFQRLQERINQSIDGRVLRHNAETNEECLTTAQEATKSGLKVRITSTHYVQHELVVTFSAEKAQGRIRSEAWDYTIRVVYVEPGGTGMQYKQSRSSSWAVLEDESGVERMLDQAFQATFQA
jgi:hypothetical protein